MAVEVASPLVDPCIYATNKQRQLDRSFYPLERAGEELENRIREKFRCWNTSLCEHIISFVVDILLRTCHYLTTEENIAIEGLELFEYILPAVAASLSLFPVHIPYISISVAFDVLPLLVKCCTLLGERLKVLSHPFPNAPMRMGKWVVRFTPVDFGESASDSMRIDEFEVPLANSSTVERSNVIIFEGSSSCSKYENHEWNFFIAGIVTGTLIRLVQVIQTKAGEGKKTILMYFADARLNLDGTRFEGTFSDSLGRVKGKIAAIRTHYESNTESEEGFHIIKMSRLCSLLSNATRHLCLILNSCDVSTEIHPLSNSSLLSGGLCTLNSSSILEDMYHFNLNHFPTQRYRCEVVASFQKQFIQFVEDNWKPSTGFPSSGSLYDEVKAFDTLLTAKSGGIGSLRGLSPIEYDSTRLKVITSILHIKRLSPRIYSTDVENDGLHMIWNISLRVMEDNIRKALSISIQRSDLKGICRSQCAILQSIADFLLQIYPPSYVDSSDIEGFYSSLSMCGQQDMIHLKDSIRKIEISNLFKAFSLMAMSNLLQLNHPISAIQEDGLLSLSIILGRGTYLTKTRDFELARRDSFWGAHQSTRVSVQSMLSVVSRRLLELISSLDTERCMGVSYSVTLSFLSVFFANIQSSTIVAIIGQGQCFWGLFKSLIQLSKVYLDWKRPSEKDLDIHDALECTNRKFVSLNLLRCSMFAMNCILMHMNAVESLNDVIQAPISLLKAELASIVKEVTEEQLLLHRNSVAADVERDFRRIQQPPSDEIIFYEQVDNASPDLFSQSIAVSRLESSFMEMMFQMSTYLSCSTLTTFVSRWKCYYLHLLIDVCSATLFSSSQSIIALFDTSWAHAILVRVLPADKNGVMLPLTFSKRVLRLFRLIVPTFDADKLFVEHILRFIGHRTSFETPELLVNDVSENDVYLLVLESISLLRLLQGEGSQSWRRCISAILEGLDGADRALTIGALALLGGLPGRLTAGSWILRKPRTALESSISRRFGSSATSSAAPLSPKAIGSGLEGLMQGLYRHESQGGIVSAVDTGGGYCDVVFIDTCHANDREMFCLDDGKRPMSFAFRSSRIPISEVLIADENSLVFENCMPLTLLMDLPSRFKIDERTALFDSTKLLLILRSYGSVLTQKSTLEYFYRNIQSRTTSPLSTLLQIASDSFTVEHPRLIPILRDHLFTIADYEARYWLIRGMIFELMTRRQVIDSNFPFSMQTIISSPSDEKFAAKCDSAVNAVKKLVESSSHQRDDPFSRASSVASLQLSRESTHNSSGESNGAEDDEVDDAPHAEDDDTAFEHLREVVILQMTELGLPRSWSEYSLGRVGGINIEAAVHFCLEHASEMERLIADERERHESHEQSSTLETSSERRNSNSDNLLRQLVDMGFPSRWCEEALVNTNRNLDDALNWILINGERLSAFDDGNDDIDVDHEDENLANERTLESHNCHLQDESSRSSVPMILDANAESKPNIAPLFEITGSCIINQQTLEVSGLPNGGFSSVGTKGVLLTKGKWYYEVLLITAGCIQIGWADSMFSGHCSAERGDGCGDGPSSWAYDGWRKYLWHKNATVWGCQWQEGDIVGCLLDMDNKIVSFTLNGRGEEIGMGVAFRGDGFRYSGGVYACISFNKKEKVKLHLGGPFGNCRFTPDGYSVVGQSILARKIEWDTFLEGENVINAFPNSEPRDFENFLRDLSDEEHGYELFLWQHRYCTDACVHMQTNLNGKYRGLSSKGAEANIKKSVPEKSVCKNYLNKLLSSTNAKLTAKSCDTDWSYELLKKCYDELAQILIDDYLTVTLAISHLYARKLIAQIAGVMSSDFNLKIFHELDVTKNYSENDKLSAYLFWCVIERCCSLYNLGWTGESSMMIVTTELLNIGVVGSGSRDGRSRRHINVRFNSIGDDSDEMPLAIMSSTLNCVRTRRRLLSQPEIYSCLSYPACFETTLIGDSGGFVIFLRTALQNAVVHSITLLNIMLAVVRRSIRVLSEGEDINLRIDIRNAHASVSNSSYILSLNEQFRFVYSYR